MDSSQPTTDLAAKFNDRIAEKVRRHRNIYVKGTPAWQALDCLLHDIEHGATENTANASPRSAMASVPTDSYGDPLPGAFDD